MNYWLDEENVFDADFLVFPVNFHQHWLVFLFFFYALFTFYSEKTRSTSIKQYWFEITQNFVKVNSFFLLLGVWRLLSFSGTKDKLKNDTSNRFVSWNTSVYKETVLAILSFFLRHFSLCSCLGHWICVLFFCFLPGYEIALFYKTCSFHSRSLAVVCSPYLSIRSSSEVLGSGSSHSPVIIIFDSQQAVRASYTNRIVATIKHFLRVSYPVFLINSKFSSNFVKLGALYLKCFFFRNCYVLSNFLQLR